MQEMRCPYGACAQTGRKDPRPVSSYVYPKTGCSRAVLPDWTENRKSRAMGGTACPACAALVAAPARYSCSLPSGDGGGRRLHSLRRYWSTEAHHCQLNGVCKRWISAALNDLHDTASRQALHMLARFFIQDDRSRGGLLSPQLSFLFWPRISSIQTGLPRGPRSASSITAGRRIALSSARNKGTIPLRSPRP
jgi:hypothetical protein